VKFALLIGDTKMHTLHKSDLREGSIGARFVILFANRAFSESLIIWDCIFIQPKGFFSKPYLSR